MNNYAARHTNKPSISSGINNYAARHEPKCPKSNYKDYAIVISVFVLCLVVVTSAIMTIAEYVL